MALLQDLILSSIIPSKNKDTRLCYSNLKYLADKGLVSDHLEGNHKILFKIATRASLFRTPLDSDLIRISLRKEEIPEEQQLEILDLFDNCKDTEVPTEKLAQVIPAFVEEVNAVRFSDTLYESLKILTEGFKTKEGRQLKGYAEAKEYFFSRMSSLEKQAVGNLPAGLIREDGDAVIEEYNQAKQNPIVGCLTGFKEIDDATLGIAPGDLWIVAGYTSEGKTQFCINTSYNSAIDYQKNWVYFTIEQQYRTVRRRFFNIHTNHATIGVPGGLPYNRVKHGLLSDEEEEVFKKCVRDFNSNPAYGNIYVAQMAHDDTVETLREKLTFIRTIMKVHGVVVDMPQLMGSKNAREKRQNEMTDIINGLKRLAMDFNDGEGLAIIAPHQITQDAREKAEKAGEYQFKFLSESSYVQRTPDVVIWLLRTETMKADHEIKVGFVKTRDGALPMPFMAFENYESSVVCSKSSPRANIVLSNEEAVETAQPNATN